MNKWLFTAIMTAAVVLSSVTAFASGINIEVKYKNENNSISVSGTAQTIKDNTSFTLLVKDPDNKPIYTEQTVGIPTDGKTSFSFNDIKLGIDAIGGEYSFVVSGYKLGSSQAETYKYTDATDMFELMKSIRDLPDSTDFVGFIKNNSVSLSVDKAECEALGETGKTVFTGLISSGEYELPEKCETESEYDMVQQAARIFRNNYALAIAIASFNDISQPKEMSAWVDKYTDIYSLNTDDALTKIDESKLYKYVVYAKERSNFVSKLIVQPITDINALKSRLYEKALLSQIGAEHYSEAKVIFRDFHEFFPYNEVNFKKLTDTEINSVFSKFSGKEYISYSNAVGEFDRLVLEAIVSRGNISGGGGGGGGGGTASAPSSTGEQIGVIAAPDEPSANKAFNDIDGVTWAKDAIEYLHKNNIISGKENGRFNPNDNITRAEFIKIVIGAAGLQKPKSYSGFSDVAAGEWYADYVYAAKENGIITGDSENRFNPDSNITREDMTVILYRAYNIESTYDKIDFSDEASVSNYARTAVAYFSGSGIVNGMGNGKFSPKSNATRAEAAKMIYETMTKFK